MPPNAPVMSDVDMAIRTLWSLSRATWHNWPVAEITQIALCLAVLEGDIATEAENESVDGTADMDRVGLILGGLMMSSIRWMDDLGINPHEYIRKAIAAQRKYATDV